MANDKNKEPTAGSHVKARFRKALTSLGLKAWAREAAKNDEEFGLLVAQWEENKKPKKSTRQPSKERRRGR